MTNTVQKVYSVKNRSNGILTYVTSGGIRREFQPNETKRISYEELVELSYQQGGPELIAHFLQIEKAGIQALGIGVEPEYYLTEAGIIDLMKNGSQDVWLDCLDFSPAGVIEIIKKLSVSLPLNDMAKREALMKKTGFDVTKAIENKRAEEAERGVQEEAAAPTRRVQTAVEEDGAQTSGRRSTPNYKIVG